MRVISKAQQMAIHAKDGIKQHRINGENAQLQAMQPAMNAYQAYTTGIPTPSPIQGMSQGPMNPTPLPGQGGLLAMLAHGQQPAGMPPGPPGAGQPQIGPQMGVHPGQLPSMFPGQMPQGGQPQGMPQGVPQGVPQQGAGGMPGGLLGMLAMLKSRMPQR